MHSYVYQVSLQPVQSETYAKAGHLPDWFYEQVCSYAENADPAWREQAIQELLQFLGPLCTRTGSRDGLNDSYEDRYSIYIYHAQTGILEPLDRWLRYADLSKPVYIGGVVSYYR